MNFKVGDLVKILIGPYAGQLAHISKIEYGKGAVNGWFTVVPFGIKETLLFAGEEISKQPPDDCL